MNSIQTQSLDELTSRRKKNIQNLDKYGQLIQRFSSLLSQTEQEMGQKFDLPSASQQFRTMLR